MTLMRTAFLLLAAFILSCEPNVTYQPSRCGGQSSGVYMEIAGSDASFPAVVRVIDDGDECSNAEHGATATDLADRTAYLNKHISALLGIGGPGAFTFGDSSTWTIPASKSLKIKTTPFDNGHVDLTELGSLRVNRNVLGALFNVGAGFTGRANLKPLVISPGAGTTDVDPLTYNTVIANMSASGTMRILPSAAVAEGEWIQFINLSTSFLLTVVDPAGGSPVGSGASLRSATGSPRSGIYCYANGLWRTVQEVPHI